MIPRRAAWSPAWMSAIAPRAVPALFAAAAAFAVSLPLLVAFQYVARSSVDVPYYDQWRFVPLVEKLENGTLTWADIAAQHDGHRIVLATLITLASARLADWNNLVEVWAGFAFLLGTGLILFRLHWRATASEPRVALRLLGAVPLMLVTFSLRQWENLLAPWAVTAFAGVFLVLLTLCLVDHEPRPKWAPAIVTAGLASFTFTNCLLVWPLVVMFLLLKHWRGEPGSFRISKTIGVLVPWLASGILLGFIYFAGFGLTGQQFSGVGSYGLRFLVAVGSPLSPDKAVITGGALPSNPSAEVPATAALGAVVLTAAVIAAAMLSRRRGGASADALYIAIAAFGFGSALMLAVGRSNLGLPQALSSRYTTWASVGIAGGLFLVKRAAEASRPMRVVMYALMALTIGSNVVAIRAESNMGPARRAFLERWAESVRKFRVASDKQLWNPLFAPAQIRDWSRVLETYNLSLFRRPNGRPSASLR